jgi:hypothetical protein
MNGEIKLKSEAVLGALFAQDKAAFAAAVAEYNNLDRQIAAAVAETEKMANDFKASAEVLSIAISKSSINELPDTPPPAPAPEQAKPISGRVVGKRPRVKIPTAADKSS